MKHLWPTVLVSMAIGLALVGPTLWRYRRTIVQTWAEALGVGSDPGPHREGGYKMLPMQWRTAALLSVICIPIPFLLGVAVSSGGTVAWSVCAACIFVLILLFNQVLLACIR